MTSPRNNQGIALVYTLLIVFIITAIALTVTIIIVNELKLTGNATDGTLAYYAAESGIERGLHELKVRRLDGSSTLSSAVAAIVGLSDNLTNSTSYSNDQSSEQTSIIMNELINENRFAQADYYDFENSLTLNLADVAESLVVSNSGADPASWAEVSWIAWDVNGTLGESAAARKIIGPTDLLNGWTINQLDVFNETGSDIVPRGYRVRIKALFGDLSRASVIPYDEPSGTGNVVDLPSLIEIKSVGQRGSFKQSLTATVPWKIPLYGLYDYVLFSEGELLKTIILSNPTYSSGPIQVESALSGSDICSVGAGSCAACQGLGWVGECVSGSSNAVCYGENALSGSPTVPEATCAVQSDNAVYGYALPLPQSVVEGDQYYVSLRMFYACSDGTCDGRDLAVEISGQSSVITDQATGEDEIWRTCTIPEVFTVGSTTLPAGDPARTLRISNHPFSAVTGNPDWAAGDSVSIDWYQISTYKIYQDC